MGHVKIMHKLINREIPEAPDAVSKADAPNLLATTVSCWPVTAGWLICVLQDVAVTLCFALAARAFKHRVADRPSALELLPHAKTLMQELVASELLKLD